jgi:hypothetical protein
MSDQPTISEITNAYNVGKDDGEAIGYTKRMYEEDKQRSNKEAALTWLCIIELVFIIGLLLMR